MPYCVICRTRYYDRSFSSDTEPCDCGNCISHRDWQDMDGDAERMASFDAAREAWREQLQKESGQAAHARTIAFGAAAMREEQE